MSSSVLLNSTDTRSEAARTARTRSSSPSAIPGGSRPPDLGEAPLPTLRLEAGLAPDEVHVRLHRARRDGDVGHRTLAFYLHDMEERRLWTSSRNPSPTPPSSVISPRGISARRATKRARATPRPTA